MAWRHHYQNEIQQNCNQIPMKVLVLKRQHNEQHSSYYKYSKSSQAVMTVLELVALAFAIVVTITVNVNNCSMFSLCLQANVICFCCDCNCCNSCCDDSMVYDQASRSIITCYSVIDP